MDVGNFPRHKVDYEYYHTPLKHLRSIRILELHPGLEGDAVRVDLISVVLDKAPHYEALSYAWGDTICTSRIQCGSATLEIPQSAYEALLHLRKLTVKRTLWIDALCIDQGSLIERSHQVQMMGDIYSFASNVLVWLGPADEASDAVLMHFIKGSQRLQGECILINNEGDKLNGTFLDLAFRGLMDRPYFRRIWPIQEVAFSSGCEIMCGSHTISFEDFTGEVMKMQQVLTLTLDPPRQLRLHRRLASRRLRQDQDKWSTAEVSRILLDARYHEATEPRDKVFALFALLRAMGLELAPPDYFKTLVEIYQETTIDVIRHDHSLSILYGLTGSTELSDCPSWVPDWSNSNPISEFIIWEDAEASGILRDANYCLSVDRRALTLYGYEIDRVDTIFARFPAFKSLHTVEAQAKEISVLSDWFLALETASVDLCSFVQVVATFSQSFTASWYGPYSRVNSPDGTVTSWVSEMRKCCKSGATVHSYLHGSYPKRPDTNLKTLHAVLRRRLDRKVLFRTQQGRFGIVSEHIELHDCVALFSSCRLPMVIRPNGSDWKLIAPAYVYGAMKGELWIGDTGLRPFIFT